jgi:hypothetical protein
MAKAGARFKDCPDARFLYRKHGPSRNVTDSDQFDRLYKEIVGERPEVLATFYNQATPATTYLRCQLPARCLPGLVRPDVTVLVNEEDEPVFPHHRGPAAVFQFGADKMRAITALHMRLAGIRTLVEVDDNYLVTPSKAVLERSGWGVKIGEKSSTKDGHRLMVRDADGVIVTTPHLADAYRAVNPNVYVCRNSVDPADWPEPVKPDDGVLRIAWTASQSHSPDAPIVYRALEWASRQKNVEVFCVGLNPGWKFDYTQVRWFDDLDAYRASFAYFDVGVAPVKPTPTGLGRSDVKALEIAMGGGLPILSDVAPYKEWHDRPALVARNGDEFSKRVRWCVSNRDEVRRMASEARAYVLRERTIQTEVEAWREAINAG